MTSCYTVAFMENMLTGEFINVAVFVYSSDFDKPIIYSAFLNKWSRFTEIFGPEDDTFSQAIMYYLKRISDKADLHERIFGPRSPYSSFNFTPIKVCKKSPQETLVWASKTYLDG